MLLQDARLYLLFTPGLCAADPWHTLTAALLGGVELVQWRVTDGNHDGIDRCVEACRQAKVPLLVNDDVALAVERDAAGAHIGQDDMPAAAARRLLGDRLLGVSTHDPMQIERAIADGADYLGFGPCHPTATKGYTSGQPDAAIRAATAAAAAHAVPLFAIGGITADNLPTLRALGVERIAVSSAILGSDDPGAAAAALRAGLR